MQCVGISVPTVSHVNKCATTMSVILQRLYFLSGGPHGMHSVVSHVVFLAQNKKKIALTGVRSRSRQTQANDLSNIFNLIVFSKPYKFFCCDYAF